MLVVQAIQLSGHTVQESPILTNPEIQAVHIFASSLQAVHPVDALSQ